MEDSPHFLALWYAQRRAAWWRYARPLALAALSLPVLLVFQQSLWLVYSRYLRGWYSGQISGGDWALRLFVWFNSTLGPILAVLSELSLLIGLALAAWQLAASAVPDELTVTQAPADLASYRTREARRAMWTWVGLLTVAPAALFLLGLALAVAAGFSPRGGPGEALADAALAVALYALLTELASRLWSGQRLAGTLWPYLIVYGAYVLLRGAAALLAATLTDLATADVLTEDGADRWQVVGTCALAALCAAGFGMLRRGSRTASPRSHG